MIKRQMQNVFLCLSIYLGYQGSVQEQGWTHSCVMNPGDIDQQQQI
jgi:hypothetical protein